ncbi:MAG: ubiquinol-cytochrome c reductase iron-sulfur subunit [Frankiales bacterium]|nr:ubiquinol-cytochrome c reductase iron-sulfur subunit [Frankiales bacterium]
MTTSGPGNTGGQQPSPPTDQTSAQAAGSIRDRLRSQPTDEGMPGDNRDSGITEHGFTQTDSRAQLHGEGRDERQFGASHPPEGVEAPVHRELTEAEAKVAERKVAALFVLSFLGVLGFIVTFFAGEEQFGEPGSTIFTPLLGTFMAVALFGIGAGAVLWAKTLMPDEEAVQERHPFGSDPAERASTAEALKEGLAQTSLPRRTLLRNTLLLGAGSLALLPLPFVGFLGRFQNKETKLATTAWADGVRLIRQNGTPVRLGDLQFGAVESVFPDVSHGTLMPDAPTLLIRMRPEELNLPPEQQEWAYQGHVAYSSICTHLGCPVKLYEQQTHNLLCPCHQSTFSASDGGKPLFGPAARPLPQLAITLDAEGYFVATGDYKEPIGPSYWERNS